MQHFDHSKSVTLQLCILTLILYYSVFVCEAETCREGTELVCEPPLCPMQTAVLTCTLLRQVDVFWEVYSPAGEMWQLSLNDYPGNFRQALSPSGLDSFVFNATRIDINTVISNVTFPSLLNYHGYTVGCNQNFCNLSIAG